MIRDSYRKFIFSGAFMGLKLYFLVFRFYCKGRVENIVIEIVCGL